MRRWDGLPFVKRVDCGPVKKYTLYSDQTRPPKVQRLNDEYYIDQEGCLRRYRHSFVKGDNVSSVMRSMSRLRDLINLNASPPESVLFITHTYRPEKAPDDVKKVSEHMRNYFCKLRKVVKARFEYVYVVEQTGAGRWHTHVLLFFDGKAPYLSNEFLESLWCKGFIKVSKRFGSHDIDNIGAYVVADLTYGESCNDHGRVKAERLRGYQSGMHLYRCSRGVKRPQSVEIPFDEYLADKAVLGEPMFQSEKVMMFGPAIRKYRYEHYFDASSI